MKFIGYSPFDFKNKQHLVIVTELESNGSLGQILECERENKRILQWNGTTKLINLYGIVSGMKYLHSHDIMHLDLNPENIYLDDFLFSKIGDFGLSTRNHTTDTMKYLSTSGLKGIQHTYHLKFYNIMITQKAAMFMLLDSLPLKF